MPSGKFESIVSYHAEKRRRYFVWRKSEVDSIVCLSAVLGSYGRQVLT